MGVGSERWAGPDRRDGRIEPPRVVALRAWPDVADERPQPRAPRRRLPLLQRPEGPEGVQRRGHRLRGPCRPVVPRGQLAPEANLCDHEEQEEGVVEGRLRSRVQADGQAALKEQAPDLPVLHRSQEDRAACAVWVASFGRGLVRWRAPGR